MAVHLVRWHNDLMKKGLVIIDINDGKIDKLGALQKHVKDKGHPYVTAWDEGAKTVKKYGIQSYPSQYLVGVDGTVIWEGFAMENEAKLKEVEGLVLKELEKVTQEERDKIAKELEEKNAPPEKKEEKK